MALDNHAECKNAVLGLLDALSKIKKLTAEPHGSTDIMKAIHDLATGAVDRHSPILPKIS